ncbi:glycosyltransferase [Mycobacterium sp. NPDC006124]|uniref:glycosyltransferase n=1 Tax=Mycobacterium sp. NPDC006124 TaxID=3156729 RepID=UPI0033BBEFD4
MAKGIDGKEKSVTTPRVAIAHDYLTQRGGAEKVVLAMSHAFPEAPIYTTLYDPASTYPEFADLDVRVSRLNKVGFLRSRHRAALPLLPFASSSIYIDADVVLSSTSGWAHGFRASGHKLAFCHSPARWLYMPDVYLGQGSLLKRAALRAASPLLKAWDRRAAASCDQYVAISKVVQRRISDVYGIDAPIVYPPVAMSRSDAVEPICEVRRWADSLGDDGSFYLCVSRLLPYKNVDAVVKAFAGGARKLVVVGRGPEAARIRDLKTANVLLLSDLSNNNLAWLYDNCRAVIAASYEDYGLTPIEAGIWGKPTVALRWGGFLDTVAEGVTGVFFDQPDPSSIESALDRLEASSFVADHIRRHVEQFSEERFIDALDALVADSMNASERDKQRLG